MSASGEEETITADISSILDNSEDDAELLQRLASRHYYSTTTALAITVGIGCILLILNMLIFAGIYYQRDRDKKRAAMQCSTSNGQESLAMTMRPGPVNKSSPADVQRQSQEPPPSYTTLARSPSLIQDSQLLSVQQSDNPCQDETNENSPSTMRNSFSGNNSSSSHKDPTPPKPPTRTTSSLSTTPVGGTGSGAGTIKKRVQIQEISV